MSDLPKCLIHDECFDISDSVACMCESINVVCCRLHHSATSSSLAPVIFVAYLCTVECTSDSRRLSLHCQSRTLPSPVRRPRTVTLVRPTADRNGDPPRFDQSKDRGRKVPNELM